MWFESFLTSLLAGILIASAPHLARLLGRPKTSPRRLTSQDRMRLTTQMQRLLFIHGLLAILGTISLLAAAAFDFAGAKPYASSAIVIGTFLFCWLMVSSCTRHTLEETLQA